METLVHLSWRLYLAVPLMVLGAAGAVWAWSAAWHRCRASWRRSMATRRYPGWPSSGCGCRRTARHGHHVPFFRTGVPPLVEANNEGCRGQARRRSGI